MFERFTDRARRVVILAQEEARALNHNYIGTEHLLLGMSHEGEGVAAQCLESVGISLEDVLEQVEEIIGRGTQTPSGRIPFTPRAKKVFELSLREALQLAHNYIGTEHILLGMIREGDGVGVQVLVKLGTDLPAMRQQVVQLLASYQDAEPASTAEAAPPTTRVLDRFGRNLTQAAREGKLDPVIGREKEIERVMQVLSRRTKNNPILIGEPGVGKTAVVEGLAQKIVLGQVPNTLRDRQLLALNLGAFMAGSRSGSEVEERLDTLRTEISGPGGDFILFVEDFALLFDSSRRDTSTVAEAVRSLLAHREVQLISTGPIELFRRIVREDARLPSLFQEIPVAAPVAAAAYEMLRALRDRYEAYHRVMITDSALSEAVRLADRYFHDRSLPATAIDLLDEASAQVRIAQMAASPDLRDFDDRIAQARRDKESAIDAEDFNQAARLREEEKRLLGQKSQQETQWRNGSLDVSEREVDEDDIRLVVEQALRERVDAESAAPTLPDLSHAPIVASVFPKSDDVWVMS
ncbi:AAA family ATPase [Micromonospora sp. STR1s_5]|nr:AAA family ATPase [Micromonospora sp. STR1s_5]